MADVVPERDAARRIGAVIFKHLDAHGTFTEQFHTEVGAKVLAHEGFISAVFREVKVNPHHIGSRDAIQLRQQQTGNRADDLVWALEEAAYHKNAYEAAVDMVDRIRAAQLAEHEPDERAADEDDARISQERADEKAANDAPSVRAS